MRNDKIFIGLVFMYCVFVSACNISKHTIALKLNDIDSTIRTIIPKHNCGCDWKEQKTNTFVSPILKTYGYLFQTIYVKTIDSIDLMNDSKKVYLALQKLDNRIGRQKRFFLEYRIPIENDTSKANIIGTWFYFKGYCEGYVIGVSAKELEKNSIFQIDREKLCNKF